MTVDCDHSKFERHGLAAIAAPSRIVQLDTDGLFSSGKLIHINLEFLTCRYRICASGTAARWPGGRQSVRYGSSSHASGLC